MHHLKNYRKEASEKVAMNEKKIADFKIRIASEKKSAKVDDQKQIEIWEKQNRDVKMRLENYKVQGKEKWEIFKTELTHDMDVMESGFKIGTVKK